MLSIEAKRKRDALFRNYASNVDFVLNTPLHEQRRVWEEGAMNVPLPENVSTEEIDEEGISAEWVRHSQAEKRKVILYLHGGGNSQGSSITHRKLVGHIVHCANVNALTLNYSLAPENPFPAGLMDAKYAWQWLLAQGYRPDEIILGGDSSGGGLVLSLLLLLKSENSPLPHSGFLLSPMLDYTLSGDSISSCADKDPLIVIEDLRQTVAYYCSDAETSNPLVSPLFGDLTGLPLSWYRQEAMNYFSMTRSALRNRRLRRVLTFKLKCGKVCGTYSSHPQTRYRKQIAQYAELLPLFIRSRLRRCRGDFKQSASI